MLDTILISRGIQDNKKRFGIKTIVACFCVVLAVVLPMIFHVFFAKNSGVKFLPMYMPVMLSGLLLGPYFSAVVALLSPLASYFLTSVLSSPMPSLERLPFMMFELLLFALICSLFSKKISKSWYYSYLAILCSFIISRSLFLFLVFLCRSFSSLSPSVIYSQILQGWPGLLISIIVLPLFCYLLSLLQKQK